jgi:hypothetical protein
MNRPYVSGPAGVAVIWFQSASELPVSSSRRLAVVARNRWSSSAGLTPRSLRTQRSFIAPTSLRTCLSVDTSMSASGVATPCSIDSVPIR